MNVVIVEDERLAADRLKKLLFECDPEMKIAATLDSVSSVVAWFENGNNCDLVLMDIQIADGICFEIFDIIDLKIPVIFTTAYNEFALRAFKVNSIDYLLKPVRLEDLKIALNKFSMLKDQYYLNKDALSDVKEVILNDYKTRFIVKSGVRLQSVLTENIVCFFSMDKITFILTNEKRFCIDYTLEQIEGLVSDSMFFRINRKYIVNINHIKEVLPYVNSRLNVAITGIEEEDLIVSRERVVAFKKWFGC